MEAEDMGEQEKSRTGVTPTLPKNHAVDFFIDNRDTNEVYSNTSCVVLEGDVRGKRWKWREKQTSSTGTANSEATGTSVHYPGAHSWMHQGHNQNPSLVCCEELAIPGGTPVPSPPCMAQAGVPPSRFSEVIPCVPGSPASRHLQAAQSTYKFTSRGQNF